MKKLLILFAFISAAYASRACYADFTFHNGCTNDTVFFHALDGSAAYSWDYGDTAAGAANVSHDALGYHIYTAPGTYYVTLFVNIGAEWDYRTYPVVIGSDCFEAGFKTHCYGNLQTNFSDFSIGSHTSQLWNFGDAASGVLNTDTAAAPLHAFTAEGNYIITYIVTDGTQTDTSVQSLHIDSTCMYGNIPGMSATVNCVNDTVTIYGSFSADVTYILWNFGDPASGLANTSTVAQPRHVFSGTGNYLVTVIYNNGMVSDTLVTMIPVIDCEVWPGDANADGEVNGEDIFPLGLYFGQHGAQRSGASANWSGQACASWNTGFRFMYLQDMVDMKMADCNGDSTINANDVVAIQANYGQRHSNQNNRSAMLVHTPTDPTLAVNLYTTTVNAGDDFGVVVSLGSAAVPATNVYGGSFTLLYDASKVDANAVVSFSLGWLDSTGSSMLTFYHEDYSRGRIEVSWVKTNQRSESGYGALATILFHTKSTASGAFDFQLEGTAKIFNANNYNSGFGGNQEVFKDVFLEGASATIENPTGIGNSNSNKSISVYPNPASGLIFITHKKSTEAWHFELLNTTGQLVFEKLLDEEKTTESIQLPEISEGLYIAKIKNQAGELIESRRMMMVK